MINRCGIVAIVGRPNVGKSTMMNHLLGVKISITSRKPQTTRDRILGIHLIDDTQVVFVDTPGIHRVGDKKAINRHMNRTAVAALQDVDAVIFMIDRCHWMDEDTLVLEQLRAVNVPVILVINKVDKLEDKDTLLPFLANDVNDKFDFSDVVPISALNNQNLDRLETVLAQLMPEGQGMYDEDQLTDRPMRFLAADLIRETLLRHLGG